MNQSTIKRISIHIEIDGSAATLIDCEPPRLFFQIVTDSSLDNGSVRFDNSDMENLLALIEGHDNLNPIPDDTTIRLTITGSDKPVVLGREKINTARFNSIVDFLASHSPHLEFVSGFKI